ncbi:MAG: polyphosphate polymerase domain-containing protein [Lachnospiraceae bacterium]|nr:polyphosphate polymerase domain-containing protein [Lachnospiraceae bacterium]
MAGTVQTVFKRYEKKYMLTEVQYKQLLDVIDEHMKVDEYGKHTICNIYFDTDDYRLIRTSIEKPLYKEKLRLRSYGIPGLDSKVFLEIKKKFDGVVYKRRITFPLSTAYSYIDGNTDISVKNEQIRREIDYFMDYYHPTPKMYIAYDRIAYFCEDDKDFRITFDSNIRFRKDELLLERGDHGEKLLADDMHLMELKIAGAIPLWLVSALSEYKIYPTSFSKYGTIYKKLLTKGEIKIC